MDDPISEQVGNGSRPKSPNLLPAIRSRLARQALYCFGGGFAILIVAPILPGNLVLRVIIGLCAFIVMFVSGLLFIGAAIYPEAKAFKESGYRFSLLSLLIWMTVIAVAIGLIRIALSR